MSLWTLNTITLPTTFKIIFCARNSLLFNEFKSALFDLVLHTAKRVAESVSFGEREMVQKMR